LFGLYSAVTMATLERKPIFFWGVGVAFIGRFQRFWRFPMGCLWAALDGLLLLPMG